MGRVPRSPQAPCSAMLLHPCLITHWTVKYTSCPITNDKQLIKATRKKLIKRTMRCGEGVHSCEIIFFPRRWPWYPEDESSMHFLLVCECLVCVHACVNISYHESLHVSSHECAHVWNGRETVSTVGAFGWDIAVHSLQAINKLYSYKEMCGEVVK